MNKLTIKSCPVCGSPRLERALTCVDHYVSGEAFHLCRCAECGFLLTQDAPAGAEMDRYYETPDYVSHSDTRKGMVNMLYHRVRSYMLGRKARLVMRESHRREGRLLDVGTGTGYFVDAMRRRGWQVESVERSAAARAFAKARFGLDVKPDAALKDYAPASFDVITLWHVAEHLEHLNETWERLYALLDGEPRFISIPESERPVLQLPLGNDLIHAPTRRRRHAVHFLDDESLVSFFVHHLRPSC